MYIMKVGDKVVVTYANGDSFVGNINGQTEKSWKILFANGDQKTIRKTTNINLFVDVVEETEEAVEEVVRTTEDENVVKEFLSLQ